MNGEQFIALTRKDSNIHFTSKVQIMDYGTSNKTSSISVIKITLSAFSLLKVAEDWQFSNLHCFYNIGSVVSQNKQETFMVYPPGIKHAQEHFFLSPSAMTGG